MIYLVEERPRNSYNKDARISLSGLPERLFVSSL